MLASVSSILRRLDAERDVAAEGETTPTATCDEYVQDLRRRENEIKTMQATIAQLTEEKKQIRVDLSNKAAECAKECDRKLEAWKAEYRGSKSSTIVDTASTVAQEGCEEATAQAEACGALVDGATKFFSVTDPSERKKILDTMRTGGSGNALAESLEPHLSVKTIGVTDIVSTAKKVPYRKITSLIRDVKAFEKEMQAPVRSIPREVATIPLENGMLSTSNFYDVYRHAEMVEEMNTMLGNLVRPVQQEYSAWKDAVIAAFKQTLLTPEQVEEAYRNVELLTDEAPDEEESVPKDLAFLNEKAYPVTVDYDKERFSTLLNDVVEAKVRAVRSAKYAWQTLVRDDKATAEKRWKKMGRKSTLVHLFSDQDASASPKRPSFLSDIQGLSGGAPPGLLAALQGRTKKKPIDPLVLMRKGWDAIEQMLRVTLTTSRQSGTGSSDVDAMPLNEHPILKTYFDMLKKGLPPGAVANKMVKDGKIPQWKPYFHDILQLDPTKGLAQDQALYQKLTHTEEGTAEVGSVPTCEGLLQFPGARLRDAVPPFQIPAPPTFPPQTIAFAFGTWEDTDGDSGTVGPAAETDDALGAFDTYKKALEALREAMESLASTVNDKVRIRQMSVYEFQQQIRALERTRDVFYNKLSDGPTMFNPSCMEVPDTSKEARVDICTNVLFGKNAPLYYVTPKGEFHPYQFAAALIETMPEKTEEDASPTEEENNTDVAWIPSTDPQYYLKTNQQYGVPSNLALFALKNDALKTVLGMPSNLHTVRNLVTARQNPAAPIPYYVTVDLIGRAIHPDIPANAKKDEFWDGKMVQNTSLGIVGQTLTTFQVIPINDTVSRNDAALQLKTWTRYSEFTVDGLRAGEEIGMQAPAMRYLKDARSWLPALAKYLMLVHHLDGVEKTEGTVRLTVKAGEKTYAATVPVDDDASPAERRFLTWKQRPANLTIAQQRTAIEGISSRLDVPDDEAIEFLYQFSVAGGHSFYGWLCYFVRTPDETREVVKEMFQMPVQANVDAYLAHCQTQLSILHDVRQVVQKATSVVYALYRTGMVRDSTTMPFKSFIRPGCNTFSAFHFLCALVRDHDIWRPFVPSSADRRLFLVRFQDIVRVLMDDADDVSTIASSGDYSIPEIQLAMQQKRTLLDQAEKYDDNHAIWNDADRIAIFPKLDNLEYMLQQIGNMSLQCSYQWGAPTVAYRALQGEDVGKGAEAAFPNHLYDSGEESSEEEQDGSGVNPKKVKNMLASLFQHPEYLVSKREKKTCAVGSDTVKRQEKRLGARPTGWDERWDQFVPKWKNQQGVPNGIGKFSRLNTLNLLRDKKGNPLVDLDEAERFLVYVGKWADANGKVVDKLKFKDIASILPRIEKVDVEVSYVEHVKKFLLEEYHDGKSLFFHLLSQVAHRQQALGLMRDVSNYLVKYKDRIPADDRTGLVEGILRQWQAFDEKACAPVPLGRASVKLGDRIEYLRACIEQQPQWEPNPSRDPPLYSPPPITPRTCFFPFDWIVQHVVNPILSTNRTFETIGAQVLVHQAAYRASLVRSEWHADWTKMCDHLLQAKREVVLDFYKRNVEEAITAIVTSGLSKDAPEETALAHIQSGLVELAKSFVHGTASPGSPFAEAIESGIVRKEVVRIDRTMPEGVPVYVWKLLSLLIVPTEFRSADDATESSNITPPDDAKDTTTVDLTKYRKMLKMHIPPEGVKKKMQLDGVDPALLFPEQHEEWYEDEGPRNSFSKDLDAWAV